MSTYMSVIPNTRLLALLTMVACISPEKGIDDSVLIGAVVIPPGETFVDEADRQTSPADTLLAANKLGQLTWRWESVEGFIRSFEEREDEDADGNPVTIDRDRDWYTFTPVATGPFTVVVNYSTSDQFPVDTGGETGGDDTSTDDTAADDTAADDTAADDTAADDTAADDTADTGGAEEPTEDCDFDESGDSASTADKLALRLVAWDLGADPDPGCAAPLLDVNSDGANGQLVVEFEELQAGTTYAVRLSGIINDDRDDNEYTIEFSGSAPDADSVIIGAYTDASDYYARTGLAGGGTVQDWILGEDGRTWTGTYAMRRFRTVESSTAPNIFCDPNEGEDYGPNNEYCADADVHDVAEGPQAVTLVAGDFITLNQALPAGTLHNSVAVDVTLVPDEESEAPDVVLDTIAPLIIGWETDEVEPNDVTFDRDTYALNPDQMGLAQELPVGSGLGYVDVIRGSSTFLVDDPGWFSPEDTEFGFDMYKFTVAEPVAATFKLNWTDAAANLDLNFYDAAGEILFAGWYINEARPETLNTPDGEIIMEPGQDYYLAVLPWSGPEGEYDYTIQIEWLSP